MSELPVFDGKKKEAAYSSTDEGLNEVLKGYSSAIYENYINADGRGTSMRHGLTYSDYESFRPEATIPKHHRDIMLCMDDIYNRVGLVKTIIDIMSDFVIQGIRISHPTPKTQRFYETWFNRVDGVHVSERIANNLFKFGTAIVSRRWARLSQRMRDDIENSRADMCEAPEAYPAGKIPCRYVFLNPAYVDAIGGRLAAFAGGKKKYGIKLPNSLVMEINAPENKEILSSLPEEIVKAAKSGSDVIFPLDPANTVVLHYKKDDWANWSKPIIYPILRDIFLLDKLQLADFTALDGAVDYVRIFKLGDLTNRIMPNEGAFEKLQEILHANNGAGVRNIVWGPDIQLEESKTDIFQFLGDDKYKPALNAIYAGLGIPPTLTGSGSQTGGATNNLVSIKTLIKRLDYVRAQLIRFWRQELEIVHKQLGSRYHAEIEFEVANFGDEETEKKLWIDLVDRNIISHEWIQKRFGANPSVEESRLKKELKDRDAKRKVPKGGPWHNPEMDKQLEKKIAEQKALMKNQPKPAGQPPEKKPKKQAGRPKNSIDNTPRKKRRFVPQIRATRIWAAQVHDKISCLVNPFVLTNFNKKNMRSLSSEQTEYSEKVKFTAFFGLKANSEPSNEAVGEALKSAKAHSLYNEFVKLVGETESVLQRPMTFQERRDLASDMYIAVYIEKETGDINNG